MSGDSDLVPPITAVKNCFPDKKVVVAFPPDRFNNNMKLVASGSLFIKRVKLTSNQLPDIVIKPDGFNLVKLQIKDAEKEIVQSKIDKIVNKIGGFITRYSYVEPSDKALVMEMIGEYKDIVANYKQFENELDMKSQELLKERIQQCQNLIKQIDYEIQYERDIMEIREGCSEFIKMYKDREVLLSKIWDAQNRYNSLLQKFESIPFHKDSATEHEIVKKLQICYGLIDKSFKGL